MLVLDDDLIIGPSVLEKFGSFVTARSCARFVRFILEVSVDFLWCRIALQLFCAHCFIEAFQHHVRSRFCYDSLDICNRLTCGGLIPHQLRPHTLERSCSSGFNPNSCSVAWCCRDLCSGLRSKRFRLSLQHWFPSMSCRLNNLSVYMARADILLSRKAVFESWDCAFFFITRLHNTRM